MLAIFNWPFSKRPLASIQRRDAPFRTIWSICHIIGCLGLLLHSNLSAKADNPQTNPGKPQFAVRVGRTYQTAKHRFETEPGNDEAAWQFARACFDWADFAASDSQRAMIASEGIAACKKVINRESDSAAAHYYLFMNLGQLAQTKTIGALKILGQMESEIKIALKLDPTFDFAGPDRNLGLLYLEAPGWPIGNGNKSKARTHLQAAVKLFPDYPENQLNLIEAELKWGDRNGALRDLKNLDDILPGARMKLTGDDWASSWDDWNPRIEAAHRKANEPVKMTPPRKSQEN
ncbi:MAG TPA: hypothetical protein VH413_12610 [Verrucomicrobiae bacterium]|jgi:tetratricopeptide (TPR) repeat protein|nr:hypothetical protein [Verrucomicrobiae bacterium]